MRNHGGALDPAELYTTDSAFSSNYLDYQKNYSSKIRESDGVLINLIREIRRSSKRNLRLLDVGCSSGNFLAHLARLVPGIDMVGIDISPSAIDWCSARPELTEAKFAVQDGLNLSDVFDQPLDIVVANAMVHHLSEAGFAEALKSFSSALVPDGYHINFDGFHPFEQEISVVERSSSSPLAGIPIHYRSFTKVSKLCSDAGFDRVEFHPFEMSFDVPRPADYTSLTSYTIKTDDGHRMSMRGVLH